MHSTSAPDAAAGVAAAFAARLAALGRAPLPAAVAHEAERALFNVLGLAAGASRHAGVDAILAAAGALGAHGDAAIPGRTERTDPHFAALVAGFAAHVDDFDDTHLVTVIHPGAACMAVLIALARETAPSGDCALRAFAAGCEAQLRAGVSISPEHYDRGWHITGTCGVIGAAVTAALLLGFDDAALARAVRLSATMTLGHRDAFGTMAKAFHPGKAAANGILAARLAAQGLDAPPDVIESERGFAAALSTRFDAQQMIAEPDAPWELSENTYKPYPCGIVAHPSIDAALQLGARVQVDEIVTLRAHVNPLVVDLMGNLDPADGLEARFSAIHGIAVALRDGQAGLAQYEDERVRRDDVRAVRARTQLVPDAAIPRDAARLEAQLRDGTAIEEHVEHARGSTARPLTDDELFAKVRALVEPVLGAAAASALRDEVFGLDRAAGCDALLAALAPSVSAHV
jgi:2-methylcitrate dehydratase PrpD